jgi:hypothetical protein
VTICLDALVLNRLTGLALSRAALINGDGAGGLDRSVNDAWPAT